MNNVKNNSKLVKILKLMMDKSRSKLSILLVLSMVLTMVMPHMSIKYFDAPNTTYAAGTELNPETTYPASDNKSNTTVYAWKNNSTIDFQIKLSPDYTYISDSSYSASKITYSNGGFRLKALVTDAEIDPNTINQTGSTANFTGGNGGNGGIYTNNGVEVKLKLYPSSDKRYIIYDLQAYNSNNSTKYVSLRFDADTQMTYNDYARVLLNNDDKLMHLVNDNSGSSDFTSFDIISYDPYMNLTPFNVAYATYYSSRNNTPYCWQEYYTDQTSTSYDSGISLGWRNIKLEKYQIVNRRVAVLARTKTIYVNYDVGSDSAGARGNIQPGAYDNPYQTIGRAIQALGNAKGYICIQTDSAMPNLTEINNSSKDYTIQSADININGRKNYQKFRIFATESEIKVTDGYLTFQDVILQSDINVDKEKPFINQTAGKVSFSTGTEIKGFKNTKGASIIHTTGTGKLGVFGTTVENCVSGDLVKTVNDVISTTSCCAITYEGFTGTDTVNGFEMNGNNQIWNNGDKDYTYNSATDTYTGARRNVYLSTSSFIQVSDLMKNDATGDESKVSVTTAKLPTPYIGAVRSADEEVIVAKPSSDYPSISGINNCPFEQYFLDDRTSTDNRIEIVEGKYAGGEATAKKNAVVKQLGSRITFKYVNENGSSMKDSSGNVISTPAQILPVGKQVTIQYATPSDITGYELDSCQVIGNGFTINNDKTSPGFGTATGTVGATNVEIRYIYKPKNVVYDFKPNGGSPDNIPNVEGQVGRRVSGILPTLTKYGYLFAGWYDNIVDPYDTGTTGKVTSLPSLFPSIGMTLYSKYNIDPNISIPVAESHTNMDGSIIFYETPDDQVLPSGTNRNVESEIKDYQGNTFISKPVPGYVAEANDSTVNPATYIYRSAEEQVGTFSNNAGGVSFAGRTPGQQTTVTFKYSVNPTVYFTLRNEFYKVNSHGTDPEPLTINGNTYEEFSLNAEENVLNTPPTRDGFNIIRGEIAEGGEDHPTAYEYKATGTFDEHSNYTFSGRMPNQNVVIKYYYQSTSNDKEFIIDYKDLDTLDNRYESIIDSIIDEKNYEDSIEADKQEKYGYTFNSAEVAPTLDPPVGTFDGSQHFSGHMPLNQAVTVTYKYNRNDYFKDVVYKPSNEEGGNITTLSRDGLSPDLTMSGSNAETQVLSDTPGVGEGWTFADLRTRELIPNVSVSDPTLYAADTFFIDKNNNGTYEDGTDRMLTDDSKFTTDDIVGGVITIVPHVRVLFENITISFASDGNAQIDTTGISTNYRSIDTWADVIKPTTTGVGYYYTFDAWYLNNIAVQDTDLLVNGGTYVAKFKKDTSLADAPKKVLFNTSIDSAGNGQITVRDAHAGYGYILAGTDDVIKAKVLATGTTFAYTHDLDGIDVNTKYHLYEVDNVVAYDSYDVDDNVSTIDASHRSPVSECYVPAVIKNYTVSVDMSSYTSGNQNVAKVNIKPTSVDYEYAIYDGSAMATGTEWQVGEVNGITFEGLVAGKTYKVVTKKHSTGVTTDTQGTNIYLDTLYNLTANSYVVTVINGTVNGENTAIVESGTQVSVVSSTTGADFDKWQVLSGGASLASPTSETTTFTMPSKNVIVIAKKRVADGTNITVTNAQYGTNDYSVYMDTSDINSVINTLAGDAERYLANHNFNIRYNVTYNKNILTFEEQTALVGAMGGDAARGAVAIDVDVDRYLDGKRVDSNAFINPPATLTGSSLMGSRGVEDITNLFGAEVFEHAPGLESYLNGEISEPTTVGNEAIETTNETEAEENNETTVNTEITSESSETTIDADTIAESSETIVNSETTTTTNNEETTIDSETTVATTESEETTTIENTTVDEPTNSNETTLEEPEEEEETVSGFTGTMNLIEETTEANINYEELVENLMLFGSNFDNTLQVKTYVVLNSSDLNNGEYKVYKVDGGLTEVPSVLSISEEAGKKGIIGFTAEKGKRYIIAYNRYNDITLINENPGITEAIPGAITRVTKRVKYGENISAVPVDELPTIDDYTYNRATYQNGEYSYKRTTKETFNLSDAIYTPLTIYVVYDTDAADVATLMAGINSALEKARGLLDNYFLLLTEKNELSAKVTSLEALVASDTSTNAQLLQGLNELEAIIDDIEPKLNVREVNYQNQDVKKNQTTNNNYSSSGYSGGGGGGGGGGAGAAGGGAALGGPGTLDPLTQGIDAVGLNNLNAVSLPNVAQNIPNVPLTLTSTNGMTKINFNDNISSFVKTDGSLATSMWIETSYGWYHANSSGALDIGWNKFGNDWFYFNENNVNNSKNLMHTGWLQDTTLSGTNVYYMAVNGSMMVGYQTINGLTYYFNTEDKVGAPIGSMAINIVTPDGRTAGSDGVVR